MTELILLKALENVINVNGDVIQGLQMTKTKFVLTNWNVLRLRSRSP